MIWYWVIAGAVGVLFALTALAVWPHRGTREGAYRGAGVGWVGKPR